MEFLPELLPAEMLEPVENLEENKPATVDDGKKVEMEIKKLNEPPLEEPEPLKKNPLLKHHHQSVVENLRKKEQEKKKK